jgi:hypothetical protein
MKKKMRRVRGLMYLEVNSDTDLPWFRMEMISAPKSCTAPITMEPTNTHSSAGTQPQMTAMAGPTIGPVPAMEVKWWPKITSFFVGTKSIPSSSSRAGTLASTASRKIRLPR